MQSHRKEREDMEKKTKYYVVREKAVPEVLLKVVEAKRILDSERATTVQEATEQVGISRSSFYKYKDDIFPFHDQANKIAKIIIPIIPVKSPLNACTIDHLCYFICLVFPKHEKKQCSR